MTEEQLMNFIASNPQAVARLLSQASKAADVSEVGVPPHGPNALLNNYGVQPGIPSAMTMPMGLEDFLEQNGHVQRSMYTNPVWAIMTGQTASSGDEPTTACAEDAPIPGDLKLCHRTLPFGVFTMHTPTIQLDEAGQLLNRAEATDYRLLNNPFADVPDVMPVDPQQALRTRVAKAFLETAVDLKRRHAKIIWNGDPANTSGNTGGYIEYNGLGILVNTGYQDAYSGVACSAADSYVFDFGQTVVQSDPAKTVQTFVETFRSRQKLASDVGVTGVQWAWVMRYQAFLAVTEVWPCAYLTYRCYTAAPTGVGNADVNAPDAVRMRDDMRQGRYLVIDGERVPVIIDDTMTELNAGNGDFESDIYLLPLRAPQLTDTGGQALFIEYFNYHGPQGMATQAAEFYGVSPQQFRSSPDGRFAIAYLPNTGFCVQAQIRTRKRIILRLPFLAARIDNVRYNVYAKERNWEPGTSFYEDGGQTSFFGPTYSSPVA